MTCLNCENEAQGNYCQHCGQSTNTQRISLNSILTELFRTLTNAERGFFYNIKQLTIAPQRTITGYIEGKRANMYPALSYAAIMIALMVFLDVSISSSPFEINVEEIQNRPGFEYGKKYGKFIRENLRYIWYLNIFFFAITSYLFFQRYNFAEHVVINAFIFGQAAFYTMIAYPIINWPTILNPVNYLAVAVLYILVFRRKLHFIDLTVYTIISLLLGLLMFAIIPLSVYALTTWLFGG